MAGTPWPKGKSGNPTGRPKGLATLTKEARNHAPEAMHRLVLMMRQQKFPKLALQACSIILDRAYGKPPQAIVGEGGEGPVKLAYEVSWKHHDTGGVTLDLEPKEPLLLEGSKVEGEE